MRLPPPLDLWGALWIQLVLRTPGRALAFVVVATLLAAGGLPRLEIRMDGRAMVPPADPTLLFDAEVREHFGWRDPLVVLLDSGRPGGIYQPDFLRRLLEISARAADLEAVEQEHVTSLATERRDRVYPGTLRFRPFLDPFPESQALLELLADDISAIRILDGTLVSTDHSAAAVLVGVPQVEGFGDRGRFYRNLKELVAPFETSDLRVIVVGAPVAEAVLGHHIVEDLIVLLPLILGTMAILLWLRLRRLWGVLLGLAEVGLCLVATFGLMGWLGVPLSLPTSILPVVLIPLGLADEIHIFSRYQRLLADSAGKGHRVVVATTFGQMLPPVLVTSITTAVGFLSFTASPIFPIKQFGLFAAAGIVYCLLFSITAIPAALCLLSPEKLRRSSHRSDLLTEGIRLLVRRPLATQVTLALCVVVAVAGVVRLQVQDSWIDGFAEGSDFRRDTEHVNDRLLGTHNLLVHVRTSGDGSGEPPAGDGRRGWLLDPNLLEEIGRFESHLRALDGVGGVLGPHSHLSTVAHLWQGRREGSRRIPDDAVTVARVYRFFDIVRGEKRRREVVNDSLDRALVTVFLKGANYQETKRLVAEVKAWEARFESQNVELKLAGDVAVSQAMIPAIVRSQVWSLLAALAGASVVLVALVRSVTTALQALAPVSAAVACVFGMMGWMGIPLGVATSMFCSITLGVGVDYAVHFLAAHRRARDASAPDAVMTALEEAGPPILTDVAVICLSFSWLALSQVPSNARLGLLVALALSSSCVLTLVGLGSAWFRRQGRAQRPSAVGSATELVEPQEFRAIPFS